MIHIIFKNLEKSELAREAILERIEPLVEKFPDLDGSRLQATLEMHNSSRQPGPDLFSVRLQIQGGRYDGIRVGKSASNLYIAIADLVEHMLERLNRFGDRHRVKQRKSARKFANSL